MLKEKVKDIMKFDNMDNKKKIENLVVFLVILIVTILAINMIWNDGKNDKNLTENKNTKLADNEQTENEEENEKKEIGKELEDILSKIKGVGKVKVLITYSESSQIVAMYNENKKETSTEEKDDTGGTRVITESDSQKDVIYREKNGEKEPITQKTINPKIEGAIITAEGAESADTKNNIIQAVEAVTGLATHKIQVFTMNEDI